MAKKGFLDGYKTYDPEREGYGSTQKWRSMFYQRMTPDEASRILNTENPYDILGFTYRPTMDEIKRAFRRLINKWHPDKNPDNPELAKEMSQKIIAAYSYLTQ